MEHRKIQQFYKNLFKLASRGGGSKATENPALVFTKRAKKGEYNQISDEEYNILLKEAEYESRFWNCVSRQTIWELLQTSLENINLSPKQLDNIGRILEEAYENTRTGYMPDPFIKEKELNINLFDMSVDGNKEENYTFGQEKEEYPKLLESPQYICMYLDDYIYGQEEAKRAASMLIWNHINGRKQNMVFAGTTGCGKTEIFRRLKDVYPNIVIHNATMLTGEGWKGNMKVRNLFDGVEKEKAERLIIVLDEADKLFEPKLTYDGIDPGRMIQNELLKIIEGDKVHFEGDPAHIGRVPTLDLDTSKVSFVFLGSFERMLKAKNAEKKNTLGFLSEASQNQKMTDYHTEFLQEDLIQYANVRQEIAGRITEIVQLHPMTEEDYYRILTNKYISPIKKMAKEYNLRLTLSEDTKWQIVKEAHKNGMGVRYMQSKLQTLLDEQLFEDCEKQNYVL